MKTPPKDLRSVSLATMFVMFFMAPLSAGAAPAQMDSWQQTLEQVVPSVVSIRVTSTRDFDTDGASHSQGTGFVVDAEAGLILTNRHMVHPGPVVAEAVFLDNEEVALEAVYRDPVHDFGFYRFDPAAVHHMEVSELILAPERAEVGLDVRVIGNDAGEKVSILDGTLSRLDRNAPNYGANKYNDFNTFYVQAASNTSGGSSGSPVVDRSGRVVALNAGGSSRAASSFFLPLDRVVRAFHALQEGQEISRGTVQAVLRYKPFDELHRLGLSAETERHARSAAPEGTGMLVVEETVPEGPADAAGVEPGDIVVRLDGERVSDFVDLEGHLDASVGRTITVEIERGGRSVELAIDVQDLHSITPARYLEVGRAVLHDLSYQQARNHGRPTRGVYVASNGYMLAKADVPAGAVLRSIDAQPVPDLEALVSLLRVQGQGQRLRIRFEMVDDTRRQYETTAVMDRRWFPMQVCSREDAHGTWPCEGLTGEAKAVAVASASVIPVSADDSMGRKLAPSLVMVDFDIPYPTAGVKDFNYIGVGTVVDAERGFVVVDRDTVPVTLGDIEFTFAGTVRVPGRVVYLHPTLNFAVLQYDPALLGDTPVKAVELDGRPLSEGARVWQVGLSRDHEVVESKTTVEELKPVQMGVSSTPRFRQTNLEGYKLKDASASLGGVVVDRKGRGRAIWASFFDPGSDKRRFFGLPAGVLIPVLDDLWAGDAEDSMSLGVEVWGLGLAVARDRGLADARIRAFAAAEARDVYEIRRVYGGTPASDTLRDTDLILEIDGELLTRMEQLHEPEAGTGVILTILRDGEEHTVEVEPVALDGQA
jgi:S1-C subfamily serine protease